ncbi:MAG: hypothetical protein AAF357_01440 [Verrucomicrobiota bacterium]
MVINLLYRIVVHNRCGIVIFFDGRWIATNREVVKSILRDSERWDVPFDAEEGEASQE